MAYNLSADFSNDEVAVEASPVSPWGQPSGAATLAPWSATASHCDPCGKESLLLLPVQGRLAQG